MAGAGAIRAGGAYVEAWLDDSKLVRGLNVVKAKMMAFGAGISAVGSQIGIMGAAIQAPLALAGHSFAEKGTELLLMARATNTSVESFYALARAGKAVGASGEEIEKGLLKMSTAIHTAAIHGTTAGTSLGRMGLTLEDLNRLSPDRQLEVIADALGRMTDQTTAGVLALDVFGRRQINMVNLVRQGGDAIRNARAAGGPWTQEDAELAHKAHMAFEGAKNALGKVWVVVGGAIAPAMTRMAERVKAVMSSVANWMKQNKGLVVLLDYITIGLVAAGGAVFVLGKAFSFLGMIVGGVGTVLKLAVTVITLVVSLAVTAVTTLLSPIGLVVAAFGILLSLFLRSSAGTAALGALRRGFAGIVDTARTAWGGIQDALGAGDLAGAMEIAWVGVQLAFLQGLDGLKIAWLEFCEWFGLTWVGQVAATITSTISELADFIRNTNAETGFVAGVQSSGGRVENAGAFAGAARLAGGAAGGAGAGAPGAGPAGPAPGGVPFAANPAIARLQAQLQETIDWQAHVREWNRISDLQDAAERRRAGPDLGALAETRTDIAGTFSGAIAGMLGATNLTQRIADATAETARNTGRIADAGAPAFT